MNSVASARSCALSLALFVLPPSLSLSVFGEDAFYVVRFEWVWYGRREGKNSGDARLQTVEHAKLVLRASMNVSSGRGSRERERDKVV